MRPLRSVAWPLVVPKLRASRWKRVGLASASVVLLSAAIGVWWIRGHTSRVSGSSSAEPLIRSLAVLPLENLSGDPAQDYFADGMTDELITDLGQIGALRVTSRTSIMQYKGAHKFLPEIAKELNIDAVVEGTVVHSGDRVRITAQLIEARTDKHLWAQSYEGEMRDIMGLQNQVASAIADQIRVKLTPQQKATLETAPVVNPRAHELYLQGQYFNEKTADEGTQKAIVLFQQAIAQQPDHALAYIGLANAYIRLGHTLALPPEKAFPAAKAAALKALEINDNDGEAHMALGQAKFLHDWDFSGAEKEFQRAVALNPSSERTQNAYASFLNAMGRHNEAVAHVRMVLQINPVSLWAIDNLSAQLYWARRYDEAVEQARKSVEMDPNRVAGHLWLGLALEQKHDFPESIARLEKAVELSHDKSGMAFVAHARALSGDKAGARKILGDLEQRSNREYVSPWWMAMVYPDLGDKEKAFFWLEKAYRGREHDLVFSKVWPMFDSLRMDPRYKDLMRRVGLPQTDTGRQ
jgi:TolB-like protein/Flp pilus assembly protein TadD